MTNQVVYHVIVNYIFIVSDLDIINNGYQSQESTQGIDNNVNVENSPGANVNIYNGQSNEQEQNPLQQIALWQAVGRLLIQKEVEGSDDI